MTTTSLHLARWLKPTVFVACLVPLALIVYDAFTGGLTANPVEAITHRTGQWSLRLLLITLAVTPVRVLFGWHGLGRLRRMLGLFAFFYVCLHVLIYATLDAELSAGYIVADIVKRPYITIGFTGLCLLIPLAATSTNGMIRRLGGARWRRLHRVVYIAGAAGVLHFLWLVKADHREPLAYLAVLALLLIARIPAVSRRLGRWKPCRWKAWRWKAWPGRSGRTRPVATSRDTATVSSRIAAAPATGAFGPGR